MRLTINNMETQEEKIANDAFEARFKWLKEHNVNSEDVMEDEDGEFYFDVSENGTLGDDGYEVSPLKVYLPDFTKNNE
jgi:hypothetical protein